MTEPLHRDAAVPLIADYLRHAQHTVAITGAGFSTASGIPDFRSSSSSLWHTSDPFQVATLTAFRRNPQVFYEWMLPLALCMRDAQPNIAHTALAALQMRGVVQTVITQNIDRLHTQAGSSEVIELHGTLWQATCTHCFRTAPLRPMLEAYKRTGCLPRCPHCGGVFKPNVILFGEELPFAPLRAARKAVLAADLVLVMGSSLEVFPANALPHMAHRQGARVILINDSPTEFDDLADVVCRADVTEVMPALQQALEQVE